MRTAVAGAVLVAALVGVGQAQELTLRQLVDAQAGLYVELPELRSRLADVDQNPFWLRLQQWPAFQRWQQTSGYRNWEQGQAAIEQAAGKPLSEVLGDLAGRRLALAVYRDGSQRPIGVLLCQSDSEQALTAAISVWHQLDRRPVERREHAGRSYIAKRTRSGGSAQFAVQAGSVFALSDDETAIQAVIDRLQQAEQGQPPAGLAPTLQAEWAGELFADHQDAPWVRVWMNPPAWPQPFTGAPAELQTAWQAVGGLACGLWLDRGPVLDLRLRFTEPPHPGWDDMRSVVEGPLRAAEQTPGDALIVLAGRTDFTAVAKWLDEQVPPRERRDWRVLQALVAGCLLQREPLEEASGDVGPDWSIWVTEQPGQPIPWSAAAMVARRRTDAETTAAWKNLMATLVRTAVAASGGDPRAATQRQMRRGTARATVHQWHIPGALLQPSWWVGDDWIGVATGSPGQARQRPQADWAQLQQRWFPDAHQMLYVNVGRVQASLRQQWEVWRRWIPDRGGVSNRELQQLDELASLCDRLFIAGGSSARTARIVLGAVIDE